MSVERALLERVGERFDFPEDAFGRLLRRRNRKVRNQRIASGLVAVIVSVLAIAGLLRALAARETGDRTIQPEPRRQGRSTVATMASRSIRPATPGLFLGALRPACRSSNGPRSLPRHRGTDGHPDPDRAGGHLADRVLEHGPIYRRHRPRVDRAGRLTGAPGSPLAGCRSETGGDGLSGSGSPSFLRRAGARDQAQGRGRPGGRSNRRRPIAWRRNQLRKCSVLVAPVLRRPSCPHRGRRVVCRTAAEISSARSIDRQQRSSPAEGSSKCETARLSCVRGAGSRDGEGREVA